MKKFDSGYKLEQEVNALHTHNKLIFKRVRFH